MGNDLLNPVAISKDGLVRLENNTVMMKMVNREFDDKYAIADDKIGYVYNARLPVRFRGRRGDGTKPEGIREQLVPIAINELWGQDLEISDQDLTLTIDRFGERYVEPATETIANMIDGDLCDQYINVFSHQGVPGTVPTTLPVYAQAGVELANNGCPKTTNLKALVINPDMEAQALGFGANLFNPPKTIGDQYLTGKMGQAVGFRWNMDQNISRQVVGALGTAGAIASNPVVTVANQIGNVILTSGWDASIANILLQGDIVSFGFTNGVNPISYRDTGRKRSFVMTANVNSDSGGLASLPIAPDLNPDTTSPFQTVMNSPAASAAVYVYGLDHTLFHTIAGISTAQGLAFHRDAFTVAIVKQELPGGMEWSEYAASPKAGLWIRLVRGYLIGTNKKITRFDVLGGVKTIRPELCCRISA